LAKPKKETAPFKTRELRNSLSRFLDQPYTDKTSNVEWPVGSIKWGVYIFYDYDGEPIYVGQTKEQLRVRIRRHLTNHRTDAVAMSVLDPYEVCEMEVFPLPQFQHVGAKHDDFKLAKGALDGLEFHVHREAVRKSRFGAILNEKDPPQVSLEIALPTPLRGCIVSDQVRELRGHPDTRMARRAQVVARLAQTISEREIKVGLRRALQTQATRMRWLAEQRFIAMGGQAAVEIGSEDSDERGSSQA